jgi:phospholipase/carboxylesterase
MTGPAAGPGGGPGAARAATAHGFAHLFLPAEPGAPLAGVTVLALHGTGGDERDLVPLAPPRRAGRGRAQPARPVLEHGMPRFFRRLAEGVFDLDDLARRTEQLGDFVDGAARDYGVDRARVVAVGFSNGANVAASLLLRRPGALAGAALLRAMVPFEPEVPPVPAPGVRPVVTIAAGRADPLVPRAQPERLAALLAAAGCDAQVAWVDAGHQLGAPDLELAADLVRRAAIA